jgi:hypothetical protein
LEDHIVLTILLDVKKNVLAIKQFFCCEAKSKSVSLCSVEHREDINKSKGELQMDNDDSITRKRSIGALRKATKTKPRSPDLTGPIKLQRHTFEAFAKQFENTEDDEIVANIAGWPNQDHLGKYLTVELSPKFVAKENTAKKNNLDFFFDNDEEN